MVVKIKLEKKNSEYQETMDVDVENIDSKRTRQLETKIRSYW